MILRMHRQTSSVGSYYCCLYTHELRSVVKSRCDFVALRLKLFCSFVVVDGVCSQSLLLLLSSLSSLLSLDDRAILATKC